MPTVRRVTENVHQYGHILPVEFQGPFAAEKERRHKQKWERKGKCLEKLDPDNVLDE